VLRITDDRNRELYLARRPARVVSLVPSETVSLFDLGVGDRLVGRTRYCVEPAGRVDEVPEIGGTKDPDVDAIAELAPDLVLANQEENAQPVLEKLVARGLAVFISFPIRAAEGIAHVARLARLLGVDAEPGPRELIRRGYRAVAEARENPPDRRPSVFVPIWMDPLMTISADTFGSSMVELAGGRNLFADRRRRYPLAADLGEREPLPDQQVAGRDTRYPRVTMDEVNERAPELVLLPDEPHPFGDSEAAVFREQPTPAAERGAVALCDGKDLFWYGSRTIDGIARLRRLIDQYR
jgi:ABC-type Fe3+-hydroxamate transport system substrate-binding protein